MGNDPFVQWTHKITHVFQKEANLEKMYFVQCTPWARVWLIYCISKRKWSFGRKLLFACRVRRHLQANFQFLKITWLFARFRSRHYCCSQFQLHEPQIAPSSSYMESAQKKRYKMNVRRLNLQLRLRSINSQFKVRVFDRKKWMGQND